MSSLEKGPRALLVGSLFAGIGGFDLGFERTGLTCAWQVEIDQRCNQVLTRHWPDVRRFGDVCDVGRRNLDSVDLICGGFPCQDLSVAGRRAGLAGERSGPWYEFARVLEELRPRWVVIENVPGLLSSNDGRDLGAIVGGLAELGYMGAYRVLDAQFHGVAQRRRRVFIVGHLGDGRAAEVLFERTGGAWDSPPSREAEANPTNDVAKSLTANYGKQPDNSDTNQGPPNLIYQCHGGNAGPMGTLRKGNGSLTSGVPFVVANSVTTREGQRREPTQDTFIPVVFDWQSGGDVRLNVSDEHASALHASQVPAVSSRWGVRRLTPRECERLQGFPDGWTRWGTDEEGKQVELSDSARYRMLGNAVCVPVAEWIGKRIMEKENDVSLAQC